jgi:FAD/FMN-containing dehydrogenase
MQMKVVLPNGTYITTNRCQNQEIFFALRGGGGGTFGVVTETTSRVYPEVPLQVSSTLTHLVRVHGLIVSAQGG